MLNIILANDFIPIKRFIITPGLALYKTHIYVMLLSPFIILFSRETVAYHNLIIIYIYRYISV